MTPEKGIILVTGSNGSIGTAVMRRFAARFEHVVGFDRKAPTPPPEGCVAVAVDVTSDDGVRDGLRTVLDHHGSHIASVIHLAAYYDFFGEPSPKYDEITVRGTGRLLHALHEQAFQVEQFVFSSTMLVHKPGEPGEFITEDWPIEPTWAYPESKVRTEKLIREKRGSIPAAILRISGVYDDGCHSIPLAHQIQRIYERDLTSRVYSGSTAHGQSFMHMDDLVDAIEMVVDRRAVLSPEMAILLGEPEALSYDELQHTIARLIRGESKETIEIPGALAPMAKAGAWVLDHVPRQEGFIKPWMIDRANDHYALDITRARTVLGWEPKRSLRETLPKMIALLKADPVEWYKENKLDNPPTPNTDNAKEPTDGPTAPPPENPMPAMPEHAKQTDHSDHADHAAMGMAHKPQVTWPHATNMALGAWLIIFALAHSSGRQLQMADIVSGGLVMLLARLSLSKRPFLKLWAPWANSLVGVWLMFAPLIFWAPTASAYANDTLIGILVIVFAVLAPGMPMAPGMNMDPDPEVPQGWSYNPSSWPQRAPIIALALLGFFLSRQMASFELGHITSFRDPIFGTGTVSVLTSTVSRAFPIADAGLGAVAYMIEFLMGFMGDKRRWRTMPWMVTFFGILVVPLGIVSITLIILQPLAVGAWCTPCLVAALAMIIMIALTLDEVVAMVQFLVQARRQGQPLWQIFWLGGKLRSTPEAVASRPDVVSAKAMVWGVALPWNLLLSAALGVWLMLTPYLLGSADTVAHSDHLFGALIVTVAVIVLADVGRAGRFFNIVMGAWVIVAPWILDGASVTSRWSNLAAGVLVILLSLRKGPVGERYGTWQPYIR